jgi:hypothetical protein
MFIPSRRHIALACALIGTAAGGVALSSLTAQAAPSTFYVSPSGSDSNDGSSSRPWRTIQHAVGSQTPMERGSTVIVRAGEYREPSVRVEKAGITIAGDPGATLIYAGENQVWFNKGVLEVKNQDDVTVRGLTINGQNRTWGGIVGNDLANFSVLDNTVLNTGSSGIIVLHGGSEKGDREIQSSNLKVLRNTLLNTNQATTDLGNQGDQESLSIWGVDGFEVAYNRVENGKREGIDVKVGSRNGSVHHNLIRKQGQVFAEIADAGPALYIDANRADVRNVDVYANVIEDNKQSAIVITSETNPNSVSDIRVYNNVIRRSGRFLPGEDYPRPGSGIAICGRVTRVDVAFNTFEDANTGMDVSNCPAYGPGTPTDIVFRNNVVGSMKWRVASVVEGPQVRMTNNVGQRRTTNFDGQAEELWAAGNNRLADSIGFVQAPGDLRLGALSPALDVGVATAPSFAKPSLLTTDITGAARPTGAKADAGAYERGGLSSPTTTTTTTAPTSTTTVPGPTTTTTTTTTPRPTTTAPTTTTTRPAQPAANRISLAGNPGTGWTQSAWNGSIQTVNRVLRLTGTDPWSAVVFDTTTALDTRSVRSINLRYRAPSGPVQILVFDGERLAGTYLIMPPNQSDRSRSVTIAWSALNAPTSVTRIAVQEASGQVGSLGVDQLRLVRS